jgi:hypothetical protein
MLKIGDKVKGIYNHWIDHPENYMLQVEYSGKIVGIEDSKYIVKSKSYSLIKIIPEEEDTININK